jgi:leucine dehydrogenase
MSYKNAMAGLPLGGGKGVILAGADRAKSPELLAAFGRAVDSLGGKYVTAEDVGMSVADMIEVRRQTRFVAGLPAEGGAVGGDPGPHTSLGVFLGIKAAVKRALGKDNVSGLQIALQGAGSVATGVAIHAAAEGARLSVADVDPARANKLAHDLGATVVDPAHILALEADVFSPNALGAILSEQSISALNAPIVAGGANNQLATPQDGARLMERGILYAPDYVINAGGIINVSSEYLGDGDAAVVRSRIEAIPGRLEQIWTESAASGRDPAAVADAMAQRLIGRGR